MQRFVRDGFWKPEGAFLLGDKAAIGVSREPIEVRDEGEKLRCAIIYQAQK